MGAQNRTHDSAKAIMIILATLVCLSGGCSTTPHAEDNLARMLTMADMAERQKVIEHDNPCGTLRISRPFFNFMGFLTAPTRSNNTLYVFIAANTR